MGERDNGRKSHSYGFRVTHQRKYKLLLRALNEMDTQAETPDETAAVMEMVSRLEFLLSCVVRRRTLSKQTQVSRRQRCAYGTRKPDVIAPCEEARKNG